jgi:PAS domain S-box-containing protein
MYRVRLNLLVVFGAVLSTSTLALIFALGEWTAAFSSLTLLLLVLIVVLSCFSLHQYRSAGAQRALRERALRESQEQLHFFALATNDQLWNWDHLSGKVTRNTAFETPFGYSAAEIEPDIDWWVERLHPEDRDRVMSVYEAAVKRGDLTCAYEYRFRRRDGSYATISDRAYIVRDDSDQPVRSLGAMTDITERLRLEEQLRQAQKMESIGRLAGGVAHDFNNILTALLAHAELAQLNLAEDDPSYESFTEICHEVHRAADLTQQLLAFARKQVLAPKLLDLSETVLELGKLLRRLLGENVELVLLPAAQACPVLLDPGQCHQILANLAVNAHDAMPDGGKLTIEVSEVELDEAFFDPDDTHSGSPDPYVRLTVSDTGTGMRPEDREKIFEPFFTTKEVGQGTGLGLSTCYGIVRQHHGHIRVRSEPGQGTTFLIDFPRAAAVEASGSALPAPPQKVLTGDETILVVEDEPSVRKLTTRTLSSAGYQVLAASTGEEALRTLEGRDADLLLTDVIMPGMNGHELARRILESHREIKVLFTSGYTDDERLVREISASHVAFLPKPYAREALTLKVREVLDALEGDEARHDPRTAQSRRPRSSARSASKLRP